ncbi:AMP-dependent synthetase and ligase [Streptomyces bingchenggensis BCW-1]|uniref:AMP-dependent synthetase and ligase n=1 Tax=Streptomyces bingchenggensis (strain BCW-1) TaxID=749414 RepID=D7BUR7_STRBB|nr:MULTISPECIES: AMP-binding protein [Streptomyces]ADI03258.1 AMP-dependent synthetase and ligase [Streptomyces bingchenggensis BCW-1]
MPSPQQESTESTESTVTIGERIGQLAAEHPAATAVLSVAPNGGVSELTWAELERLTNCAARGLAERGVTSRRTVAVALPAGPDHVVATVAAWKLGSLVVPLDPQGTAAERAALAAAIGEHVLIGDVDGAAVRPGWWRERRHSDTPLPRQGTPRSATLTGGTTGLPRVIVRPRPWTYRPGAWEARHDKAQGMRLGQTQLLVLPLYHTGFQALYQGLALDHRVIIMERFVPSLFLKLVQEHRVSYVRMVAAMMRMLLDVPGLRDYDLSSIETLHHGAGPCPEQVKRAWLELIDPGRVYEIYASQERVGRTVIRGDEWLKRPGSVGRPTDCEIRIYDEGGRQLPAGEVGEVFMRTPGVGQPSYLGDGPRLPERDGFLTVGDLGHLDADGYLYLVDRKSNVINVGGKNVYPAEVEAVLLEMPGVADAVVTGRRHEYLGEAVHALVVPSDPADPVTTAAVDAYCRERLSDAKVPMTCQIVASVPRQSSGKVRRAELGER